MKAEVRMQVRMPAQLRDALAKEAKNNHRSMNGQLLTILAEHFRSVQLDCVTEGDERKSNHRK